MCTSMPLVRQESHTTSSSLTAKDGVISHTIRVIKAIKEELTSTREDDKESRDLDYEKDKDPLKENRKMRQLE